MASGDRLRLPSGRLLRIGGIKYLVLLAGVLHLTSKQGSVQSMNNEGDTGICKENQKTVAPDSQKESGLISSSPPAKMNHAGSPSHSKEGGGDFSLDLIAMYRAIDTKFWTDEKVKTFPLTTKAILLYLLTNPHTHLSGIYYLPLLFIRHETKATEKELSDGLALLQTEGIVKYDPVGEVVWIVRMLSYQPESEKITSAVETQLAKLHNCCLIKEFLTYYQDRNIPYRYPIDRLTVPVTNTVSVSNKGIVKGETPHQVIINRFLELQGTKKEDLTNEQVTGAYKRHSRSALALIKESGGLENAITALEWGAAYFDGKSLTWTIDTIAKHLPTFAKCGRSDALARKHGLTPKQVHYAQQLADWMASKSGNDGARASNVKDRLPVVGSPA